MCHLKYTLAQKKWGCGFDPFTSRRMRRKEAAAQTIELPLSICVRLMRVTTMKNVWNHTLRRDIELIFNKGKVHNRYAKQKQLKRRSIYKVQGGDLGSTEAKEEWGFINNQIKNRNVDWWHIGLVRVSGICSWVNGRPLTICKRGHQLSGGRNKTTLVNSRISNTVILKIKSPVVKMFWHIFVKCLKVRQHLICILHCKKKGA